MIATGGVFRRNPQSQCNTGVIVNVTGTLVDSKLRVASLANVVKIPLPNGQQALLTGPLLGTSKLLHIIGQFDGMPAISRDRHIAAFGKLDALWNDCSKGKLRIDQGTVYVGPIDMGAPPSGCPDFSTSVSMMEQAKAAVTALGIDVNDFVSISYSWSYPSDNCWLGWASMVGV